MRRALPMLIAVAVTLAALAPGSSANPPALGGPLRLEIQPGGGPQRTGSAHTLEAKVERPNGEGVDGVVVDFEIAEGPADDDVGTAGATPEAPDLSCVTAGGSAQHPATCTVSYVEQDNVGGSDAVLAWVDADDLDATVEADLGEGENQHAPGTGGCTADSKGPGADPEPDATDCVEKRWQARLPAVVDLSPEIASDYVGGAAVLEASVLDQFGDPLVGPGTNTTVAVELLAGSVHHPGLASPTVGTCSTGEIGGCSVAFQSSRAGTDLICAYVPDRQAACAESPDAPERDNGADVVRRTWGVLAPPPPDPPAPPPTGDGETPDGAGGAPAPDGDDRPRPQRPKEPRRDEPGGQDRGSQEEQGGDADAAPAAPPARDAQPAPAATDPDGSEVRSESREPRSSADAPRSAERDAQPRGGRSSRRTRRRPEAERSVEPAASPQRERRARPARKRPDHRLTRLSRAAVKTAERYSFPLALTLLVLGFVAVQGRIDHRDPKLRLAPVDAKHDLLPFT